MPGYGVRNEGGKDGWTFGHTPGNTRGFSPCPFFLLNNKLKTKQKTFKHGGIDMRKFSRFLSVACAVALVVASPLTVHAQGFIGDQEGWQGDDGWGGESIFDNSSDSGSSSDNSYSEPEPSYEAPSESYDSGSSDDYQHGFIADQEGWQGDDGWGSGVASSSSSAAPVAKKNSNDVTMSAGDGQKFRVVMDKEHTTYQVYHCGISKVTFAVADKDGNAVKYSDIKVEKGDDGLYYANITFAEGVDTTGYTVTATKGDPCYLSTTLNVKGIKVNGVLALSTLS